MPRSGGAAYPPPATPASPPTSNAPAHPPSASGSISMAKHNPSFSPTMIPPNQLLVHFGGLCCTGQEGWQKAPKRLAPPTIKVMLSARRRTNRQLGMVRTRAAEQSGPPDAGANQN